MAIEGWRTAQSFVQPEVPLAKTLRLELYTRTHGSVPFNREVGGSKKGRLQTNVAQPKPGNLASLEVREKELSAANPELSKT